MSLVIDIDDEVTRWVAYPRDKDDRWSRDSYGESHNVEGFSVVEEDYSYNSLQTSLDEIEFGIPHFLVYVQYSTGDSFGSDSGNMCFVELFKSANLAQELVTKIELAGDSHGEQIEYTVDNGETREVSSWSWSGYFEHIEQVGMHTLFRSS